MAVDGGGLSRRRFLVGLGVGVVGAAAIGVGILGDEPTASAGTPLGNEWLFGPFVAGCTNADYNDEDLVPVTVPHCVAPLSWEGWDPASWEQRWIYRQYFDAPPGLRSGRAFVRFEGILSAASVFVNGRHIDDHEGGYLPVTVELTGLLRPKGNVLAVAVDGRWNQEVPPNVPRFPTATAIDFYQPGGMYRPVAVSGVPSAFVSDVFARPVGVLTPGRSLVVTTTVDAAKPVSGPVTVTAELTQSGRSLGSAAATLPGLTKGTQVVVSTLTGLSAVRLWDVTDPALCDVTVTLRAGDRVVHTRSVRTGFRDAVFTPNGFFLNGRRLKLFGLNRHQWYPYVGGAMPDRVQRRDAQILREVLACNMVRCSHYPQSPAFLDACDELGLLVWEEIPGWDYLGNAAWQNRMTEDVRDMVVRDRNHPSIVVWGTRVNETIGQLALYNRTDRLALELDPSRPCTGALAGRRGYYSPPYPIPDGTSVFSYNDYTTMPEPGNLPRAGAPPGLRPPREGVPYLVSEAVGTISGPPHYRRVDPQPMQRDQAMLHAWVHDRAAADDRYCGLLAWCGFDYGSGWLHSVNGVKYPGVADFFRVPKPGAAFYRSQVDPAKQVVIEPSFYWDFGPSSPPTGPGPRAALWSNCDRLDVFLDERRVATLRPDRAAFPHLDHPPFLLNLTVRAGMRPDLRVDGYLGNRLALTRRFSADPTFDTLSCVADDTTIDADGQDATRVVLRAVDRYGAPRPYVTGWVSVTLDGPGTLIGDSSLDFTATGGTGAVWVRSVRGQPGTVTVYAVHATLGGESVTIQTR